MSRELLKQFAERLPAEPGLKAFKQAVVRNSLPDPDVHLGYDPNLPEFDIQRGNNKRIYAGDREEAAVSLAQNSSLNGFEPPWVRPFPPQLPMQDGELVWLTPDYNHELVWDNAMCADTSRGAAVRELIAKALKGALSPARQQQILGNWNPIQNLYIIAG